MSVSLQKTLSVKSYRRKPPKKLKKLKKIEKEAKAKTLGEELGKRQARRKATYLERFTNLAEKLVEHHGDKIPDLAAALALTPIIHWTIINNTGLLDAVSNAIGDISNLFTGNPAKLLQSGESKLIDVILFWLPSNARTFISRLVTGGVTTTPSGQVILPSAEPTEGQVSAFVRANQALIWLVSFALAWIIVKHAGQIAMAIGDATHSLIGILKFLLPVAA